MDRGEIEFRLYEQRAAANRATTGRPKLDGTMEEALKQNRQWDEETETRRTLQNRPLMYRAMQSLGFPDSEKCSWLWSKKT
jgi:hypothetical protein